MKTDFVEIFQTIRANLQPYTSNGFTARVNSEIIYELWSEKLFDTKGNKIEAVPFANVKIEDGVAKFCLLSVDNDDHFKNLLHQDLLKLGLENDFCFSISKIDDELLEKIIDAIAVNFANFKQKGWV